MYQYDMSMSDLMMKIGSQLWLVIMLILVLWSEEKGTFPSNNVRTLLANGYKTKILPTSNASASSTVSAAAPK